MILADTSIWIEHLRGKLPPMESLLRSGQVLMHPFIAAELAIGSLRNRTQFLAELDRLRQVQVAQIAELRTMIESRALYAQGIGLVDAHLIASCLLTPGTSLWTRDSALRKAAAAAGIAAEIRE